MIREKFCKNKIVHISDRSHLNLTLNILETGNSDLLSGGQLKFKNIDTYTMVFINEGKGMARRTAVESQLSKGHGFFLFPGMELIIENPQEENLNITWVTFIGYLIDNYLGRANITQGRPLFQDKKGRIGEKVNSLYLASHKLPNRYCRMASMLYDIFACLLEENPTKTTMDSKENAEFYTMKAIDYMERNLTKNLQVEEVAMVLGISRKHLYHAFSYVLNTSPKKYMICLRIEKAAKQLRYSEQSISEIAEIAGYQNQFYFSKEFKRLTGFTPSQYRVSPVDIRLCGNVSTI